MCLNILGFISGLIEADREKKQSVNTDGMTAGNSLGFMARERKILYRAIRDSIGIEASEDFGTVYSDREYPGIPSRTVELKDAFLPRQELTEYLKDLLKECDVLVLQEGPVDLEGFGDSLFGHFDERTREIQKRSGKGYLRVCNTAGATAMAIPGKELGCATLLICESDPEKVARLLKVSEAVPEVRDELIERYFLNIDSYRNEGYQV